MKKTLLMGLAALPLMLAAQTIYFEDDFESYAAGDYLCTQSGTWTTWANAPGTTEDAFVSDFQAAMGSNSVILSSPGGDGPTDLVLPLGNQTSGQWTAEFYIFVAANNGGYFNFQKTADPGTEWAMDVYFNADGSGFLTQNNMDVAFAYSNNTWVHVEVWVDLDTDEARCFIEGAEVHAWQWTIDNLGDPGLNQLGGINFYAAADTGPALFFIDEVVIYGPDAFATGIEESEALAFDLFPSPTAEVLNISIADQQDLYMSIYDLTGKVVMENLAVQRNASVTTIDVSELNSGIYLLELQNKKQRFTKRFVKH